MALPKIAFSVKGKDKDCLLQELKLVFNTVMSDGSYGIYTMKQRLKRKNIDKKFPSLMGLPALKKYSNSIYDSS